MKKIPFDFNNPADARKFLRDFRTKDGKKIIYGLTKDGAQFDIDLAPDELICWFAERVFHDVYEKDPENCFCVETTFH